MARNFQHLKKHTSDAAIDAEVRHRVAAANVAFVRVCKAKVWSSRALSRFTRLQLFQSIVISVLLYGTDMDPAQQALCCFVWLSHELPKAHLWHIFEGPHLKCSHPVSVSSMFHGLPTEEQEAWVVWSCLRYARLPKVRVLLFGQVKGSNPPGRPRKIWNDIVLSDFQQLNIKRRYRDAQNKSA